MKSEILHLGTIVIYEFLPIFTILMLLSHPFFSDPKCLNLNFLLKFLFSYFLLTL